MFLVRKVHREGGDHKWTVRALALPVDGSPANAAFNFISEGDTVVVEAKGDNVAKSGERYDNEYCMVWKVENGRITQIKEYCDTALVERVLGPFPKDGLRTVN